MLWSSPAEGAVARGLVTLSGGQGRLGWGDLFVQITAKHFIKFQRGFYMTVGLLQTDYRKTISLFRSLTSMSLWVHISEWLAREMPIGMCVLDAAASPAHGSPIPYANWVPQPSTHLLIFSFGHMPVSQHSLHITTTGSTQGNSKHTLGTLWAHSGHTQRTLREHSANTQGALRAHPENTQRAFREHAETDVTLVSEDTYRRLYWCDPDESYLVMKAF